MKKLNCIGIWMDHQSANLIEFTAQHNKPLVINSKFTHEAKELSLHKSEQLMHQKEQHQQNEYYKEIAKAILAYTDVVLFGPTDAKQELYNILSENHNYDNIHIRVVNTDKMSENQQQAFVHEKFSSNNSENKV